MGLLDQLGKVAQNSGKLLQKQVEDYIIVDPPAQQLTLRSKTVELLCQKAIQRVDQLTALEPDPQQGLLATIEQNPMKAKIHFIPEKVCIKGDFAEGQLRLLQQPQVESPSGMYRTLIAGWSTFLGGYIPNQVLPEGVRVEGDLVYYTLPKGQLRLVDALFHNIQDGSALNLDLQQGELHIKSTVAINWRDVNLLSLIQLFTAISSKKS
jgi:hypothetical protein